ncbi:hypothetical protein QBC43DRAFT_133226 [Cladorrhinum sp. PSN259]|nr:hypothetical protein QBC43DRAFT_133226 [Cladorrhinum sp. PSN259]
MSSLPPDPWKALGVDRNADKAEIRTAYKKLVLKCHPDKVQDATLKAEKQEEFQKVQQAWELLNDDVERAKYEAQLAKLAAKLREASGKNSANTSVPRSAPTYYANVDIRTAEPPSSRYKGGYSGKVYTHSSPHTRSNEEVPSARTFTFDEADMRTARRATSYDKVSSEEKREKVSSEEKRAKDRSDKEDKRRRKEEEELRRLREERLEREQREREKEKERKKKYEKLEREKEREREREREKRRQHSKTPYVESYNVDVSDCQPEVWVEDEEYVTASRSKEKRSSSKKHDESRDREKLRDREREREREREKSASRHTTALPDPERKHLEALNYITKAGGSAQADVKAFWKSESPQDSYLQVPPPIPAVPTPPPVELSLEEESLQRSARKAAAARRPSHDTSRSSKEKFELHDIHEITTPSRPIPNHTKSNYTKPVPESPPRMNRSHTTPHESYDRPIPGLSRNKTWASGDVHRHSVEYDDYGSDDDRERRHRERRSRRNRSPEVVYKVDGLKATKLEKQYPYGESPTSTRRHASETHDGVYSSPTYGTSPYKFKVKESRRYTPEDVQFATYEQQPSSYYSTHEYVPVS